MSKKKSSISASQLIKKWKLNKSLLAAKMKISPYSLKMKVIGNYTQYKFSDEDIEKLKTVLAELSEDISNLQ